MRISDWSSDVCSSDLDGLTDFGFDEVPVAEKATRVRGVFDSVARNYDRMNDFMSLGIHRVWKEAFMDWAVPRPSQRLLDVAGGTRSEEHTSELQSLMRISYAVFCLKKQINNER